MSRTFNLILARFRNLGLEVLSICHARGGKDDGYGLDVRGGSRAIIEESADQIGLMSYKGQNLILSFEKGQNYTVKDTGGIVNVEIPHYSSDQYPDSLAQIVTTVKSKLVARSKAQLEVLEHINQYKEAIEAGQKPKDFDAIIAMLADEPNKAVALQIRPILTGRLSALKFKYDKATKAVVDTQAKKEVKEEPKEEAKEEKQTA